jgi:hypothetical protein
MCTTASFRRHKFSQVSCLLGFDRKLTVKNFCQAPSRRFRRVASAPSQQPAARDTSSLMSWGFHDFKELLDISISEDNSQQAAGRCVVGCQIVRQHNIPLHIEHADTLRTCRQEDVAPCFCTPGTKLHAFIHTHTTRTYTYVYEHTHTHTHACMHTQKVAHTCSLSPAPVALALPHTRAKLPADIHRQ